MMPPKPKSFDVDKLVMLVVGGLSLYDAAPQVGVTDRLVYRRMQKDDQLKRIIHDAFEKRDAALLRPCGTTASYNRGCRCPRCRAANAAWHKEQRKRRSDYDPDRIPHGLQGHDNYDCRCDVCRAAKKAENEIKRTSRKGSPPDQIPHGTASGYQHWWCRCDDCFIAWKNSPSYRSIRTRYLETLDRASRHFYQWTGPEMELAARTDLNAQEVAFMVGRTRWAVQSMRKRLRNEPKIINAAGISRRRRHYPSSRPSSELSPTSHQADDPAGPDPPTHPGHNEDMELPDEGK